MPELINRNSIMEKMMPLEELSGIKGAVSSESVETLFDVIRNSSVDLSDRESASFSNNCISIDNLREDVVINSESHERNCILNNFPNNNNGYLVVAKVIEN